MSTFTPDNVNSDATAQLLMLVPTLTDDLVIVILSSFLYGGCHAMGVYPECLQGAIGILSLLVATSAYILMCARVFVCSTSNPQT